MLLDSFAGSDESAGDPALLLGEDDLDDRLCDRAVDGDSTRRHVAVDAGEGVVA